MFSIRDADMAWIETADRRGRDIPRMSAAATEHAQRVPVAEGIDLDCLGPAADRKLILIVAEEEHESALPI